EWCEFCWSVRKLFDAIGVEYRSIDIDAVAYQADDEGVKIRQALGERVGTPTMPQIFVAGEHLGGCTELIEAYEKGELAERFRKAGIDFEDRSIDAWSLLPQWLHARKSA
ncbi:MAG: glutaredoxin, partial [Pseudomonadota bacterium]